MRMPRWVADFGSLGYAERNPAHDVLEQGVVLGGTRTVQDFRAQTVTVVSRAATVCTSLTSPSPHAMLVVPDG